MDDYKDKIVFRMFKPEDSLEWFKLKNRVWRDAYKDIFPEEVFDEKDREVEEKAKGFAKKEHNSNENIAYVAEYEGKLVGLMSGSIKSTYDHFYDEYADLIALYIDPEYQGLGIGTKFKNIFEEWAKKNGATKYVIGVLKDNHKARKVYESWGGKLDSYEQGFVKLGVSYPEVFYVVNL